MANFKCPVCKKEWAMSLQVARHIFGTGDKAHRNWVNAQEGLSYADLLVQQATSPGNASYEAVAKAVEKAQDSLK
jgi:hypothetical protein